MATVMDKRHLLDEAGYKYSIYRMMYFNRNAKKAFSIEFVQDHDAQELSQRIQESKNESGWSFYTNSDLTPSMRLELEQAMK